ncbi:unnamed protein product [Arabidopsis halleri]
MAFSAPEPGSLLSSCFSFVFSSFPADLIFIFFQRFRI